MTGVLPALPSPTQLSEIVAGGEIIKKARNWLGEHLDASARSQVLFMLRSDIFDLYVVNSLPVPSSEKPLALDDDIPRIKTQK